MSAVLSLLETNETNPGQPQLAQLFRRRAGRRGSRPALRAARREPAGDPGRRPRAPAVAARGSGAATRRRSIASDGLRSPDPVERLRAALAFLGLAPWTERRLVRLAGLAATRSNQRWRRWRPRAPWSSFRSGPGGRSACWPSMPPSSRTGRLRALGRLHAAHPRHSAIPRAQLAAAFPDLANEALAAGLIERLKAQGKVVADSRTVALRGFQPKLSQGERKLKTELAETIRAGGMSPPDAAELAAAAGPRAAAVPDLLALLRDEEHIVEITHNSSSTPTSNASCAAASASGSPTARPSRWPSSATCWARPGNTRFRSANTSTASA